VAESETLSLALTGLFGLVSTVGVVYQVIDIRQRSRKHDNGRAGPVAVAPPNVVAPAGWQQPAQPPKATPPAQYSGPVVAGPPPVVHHPPAVPVGYGPPRTPSAVVGARVLLLVASVLTAIGVAFVLYVSQVEYGDTSTPSSSTDAAQYLIAAIIVFLIFAVPLATAPTLLSILIGRGRNGARIFTVVVAGLQAFLCPCFGAYLAFAQKTAETPTGRHATGGNIGLGVTLMALGIVSIVVAIMLFVPQSTAFFRSMAQWRAAHQRRSISPG
jgi:hypothetical protein